MTGTPINPRGGHTGAGWIRRVHLALLAWAAVCQVPAQDQEAVSIELPRAYQRSGEQILRAFAPVSKATRNSIVKLNVNGETVALATVIDANGLALTKASELKPGRLTCWLATEKEVYAHVLGMDEEEDLALLRIESSGLRPIAWATGEVAIGQWAITPGVADTPQAVGIVSALPHRVRPQRAFIGVRFDFSTPEPRIQTLVSGLGAELAHLKPGDVVAEVNGTSVTNRDQVVELLRDFRDGQTIKLGIRRETERFDAEVRMMLPKAGQLGPFYDPQERVEPMGGELSQRAQGFERAIEHDTVLPPWLCGGPLMDLDGKAIGLNIARAGRVSTYALPPALVLRVYERLKAGQPKREPPVGF